MSSDSDVVMVFLVDDKPSVTDGLTWLLESVKIPSAAFNSVSEFMQAIHTYGGIACAVVDLRMPEMSGLELQKQLISEGIDCPLVFLTAHGDVPAAVNAIQAGAVDFVQKPFNPEAFLTSVRKAIRLARELRRDHDLHKDVRQRLKHLSAREREVLQGLVDGLTSKEIARRLDISPKTVDVHRANVIRKMGTERSAELLQLLGNQKNAIGPDGVFERPT